MVGTRATSSWFSRLPLLVVVAASVVSCLGEKKMLVLKQQLLQFGGIETYEKCRPQRSRRVDGATLLEMKHQNYYFGLIKSRKDFTRKLLAVDNARFQSLQSRMGNTLAYRAEAVPSEARIPLNSRAKLQTSNYVVTIELGGKQMTVIVDTGNHSTWAQCVPCKSCYSQEDLPVHPMQHNPPAIPYRRPPESRPSATPTGRAATMSSATGMDPAPMECWPGTA